MGEWVTLVTSIINLGIAALNFKNLRDTKKMKDADRGHGLHRWKN